MLILFVGTRNEVGGDWDNYYNFFTSFETKSFDILHLDFLFFLINYVFYNSGFNIFFLNTFTALVGILLIIKYSQNFYNPKLAILISIPYIIFVVLMGYNRQGIALCILMYSINYFKEEKYPQVILLIIIASLFHYASLFYLLFIFILIKNKLKILINFILLTLTIILFLFIINYDYLFSLFHFFDRKIYFYVADGNYFASSGLYYRLLINLVPSIILIIFYKKFDTNKNEKRLYLIFSLLTIIVLPIASFGSTFVDRLFIFLYPIQLYVFSNYNYYITKRGHNFFIFLLFIFYFIILYVYLVYGVYSSEWIPYKSILLYG